MQLLLDTHIFLFLINGDKSVPQETIRLTQDNTNKKFISIASIWEMTIKIGLGKLSIINNIDTVYKVIGEYDLSILDIHKNHLKHLLNLPHIHKDPFDRLIISQAIADNLTLITDDQFIKNYPNLKLL